MGSREYINDGRYVGPIKYLSLTQSVWPNSHWPCVGPMEYISDGPCLGPEGYIDDEVNSDGPFGACQVYQPNTVFPQTGVFLKYKYTRKVKAVRKCYICFVSSNL